jgi:hypothetical protein
MIAWQGCFEEIQCVQVVVLLHFGDKLRGRILV